MDVRCRPSDHEDFAGTNGCMPGYHVFWQSGWFHRYGNEVYINMGLLCGNAGLGDLRSSLHGLGMEGDVAWVLFHELTHAIINTQDFGYIGDSGAAQNLYPGPRTNNADHWSRFFMNFYPEFPKCKLDPECCSEMGEE